MIHLKYRGRGFWEVLDGTSVFNIEIPAGFVSDLDSVPRLPLFHTIFKGRTVEAALLHDYLRSTDLGRKQSDKIFLQAMVAEGVRKRYRLPIYWAVRLFGRWHKPKKKP